MSLVLDEHRQYLADEPRVSAFREAISEVVKPGDVVVDLGSGTGILGLLACRTGAQRVYSIDEGSLIELARELCRANGYQDRVTFIKGLSTRVELPEKADVVVADQIGRFGFEAGVWDFFSDARQRFLKPNGRMIPSRIDLYVAPVECAEMDAQVRFWDRAHYGFDLRPARSIATNTGYPVKLDAEHLLGPPSLLTSLDLSLASPAPLSPDTTITIQRTGDLHGIGGWFSAQLSSRIVMSNSPLVERPIDRRNIFLPIDRAVAVEEGDSVQIALHIVPTETMVSWNVKVWKKADDHRSEGPIVKKAEFAHSTFKGMLISREDLQRTQPEFVPNLSPWGEARRTVVNLCDGKRTISEIERETYHSHRQLFPSLGRAAAFVAEVVTRYSL